jgi:hypothetical protein
MNYKNEKASVHSGTFPKHVTTNVELFIRNSRLESMDQLYDVCAAVKENQATEFCVADKRADGIMYVVLAAKWVFKIVPGAKNGFLESLWRYCPLYVEDFSFERDRGVEEWYAREKMKRDSDFFGPFRQ